MASSGARGNGMAGACSADTAVVAGCIWVHPYAQLSPVKTVWRAPDSAETSPLHAVRPRCEATLRQRAAVRGRKGTAAHVADLAPGTEDSGVEIIQDHLGGEFTTTGTGHQLLRRWSSPRAVATSSTAVLHATCMVRHACSNVG